MRQIVEIGGGGGNSQNAPVRMYVLYFERLTGWAWEGQGRWGSACTGDRPVGWPRGVSQVETGGVPDCKGKAPG